jgi:hypothetical protein
MEYVIGLDPERVLAGLPGDRGVAVAVAADPAPEAQERRHPRWPLPRSWAGTVGVECGVRGAVEARHHREQRRVEHRHRGPDLVERFGRDRAKHGGAPQQRDLLAQPSADLPVLGRSEARVVQALEQLRAAPKGDQRRSSTRLGRVGRQDRGVSQRRDRCIDLGLRAAGGPQPGHGFSHRVVEIAVPRRALPTPQGPHAATGLGQVDQLEVEREGQDDRLCAGQVEPVELRLEPGALHGVIGAPQGDGPPADALDQLEDLDASLLGDDLAEQGAEQADLGGERVARPGRADAGRFGPGGLRAASRPHGASCCAPFRNPATTRPQPSAAATFPTLVS